jgi:tRNA A37 threonylcarbamoyltransferase TsaD
VLCNKTLRTGLFEACREAGIELLLASAAFCTDNAAMIAAAAERQGRVRLADPRLLSADPNFAFELQPLAS